jgi:hypothetical protein
VTQAKNEKSVVRKSAKEKRKKTGNIFNGEFYRRGKMSQLVQGTTRGNFNQLSVQTTKIRLASLN